MRIWSVFILLAGGCQWLAAAELKFDFGRMPLGQPPPGFRSMIVGAGKPGDWQVIEADFPSLLPRFDTNASTVVSRRAVVAQLAQDPTDEHFPLLVYEGQPFGDFKCTTRFKAVAGQEERMAGLAFRLQDEKNFYLIRANAKRGNVWFYKVVDGVRGPPAARNVPVAPGQWHELTVECRGTRIQAWLDGVEATPEIGDSSFGRGKLAFWTKSDAVSYFADTVVTYTPLERPAQVWVRAVLKEFPHLLGLKIYAPFGQPPQVTLIAGADAAEVGQPGGPREQDVLATGNTYYGKGKGSVSVLEPLRDRNGDVVAAVRVVMKSFPGQTEETAVARAVPVMGALQKRVTAAQDLLE
jgi:hypothetical protein